MKVFHIERNGGCGYDEYDSAVIVADTPEQALERLKEEHRDPNCNVWYHPWGDYDVTITEVDPSTYTKPTIIIESFNAG